MFEGKSQNNGRVGRPGASLRHIRANRCHLGNAMNVRVKAQSRKLAAGFTALSVALAIVIVIVIVPGGPAPASQSLSAELRANASRLATLSRELPAIEVGLQHGLDPTRLRELQAFVHDFEATCRSEAAAISRLEHRAATGEESRPPAALTADTESEGDVQELQGDRAALNSIEQESHSEQASLTQYSSSIKDETKSQQSTVNQTNEAVTQQANLASSLIQELSDLLSSIFR